MSKAGSSLAAFLLSVPVSAILLMAVFGIPRFAPGVNPDGSPSGWQGPRQFLASLAGGQAAQDDIFREYEAPAREQSEDPFLTASGGRRSKPSTDAPSWGDAERDTNEGMSRDRSPQRDSRVDPREWPFEGHASSRGETSRSSEAFRGQQRAATHQPATHHPGTTAGRPVEGGANVTWSQARRRLSELGIQQFHLEPGGSPESFLFVCMFSPGDDPRVTRRFESEAADPLEAVSDVLYQIDSWLEGRFSQRTQRVSQGTGSNPFGNW